MHYFHINSVSKEPLYRQIVDQIEEAIANKHLRHGDELPTESMIAKTFVISSIVVKKAYSMLRDKGIVKTIRGKGSFISIRPHIVVDYSVFTKRNKTLLTSHQQTLYRGVEPWKEPFSIWFTSHTSSSIWIEKKVSTVDGFPVYFQEVYVPLPLGKPSISRILDDTVFPRLLSFLYPNSDMTIELTYHPFIADASLAMILSINEGASLHHQRTFFYIQHKLVAIVFHYFPAQYVSLERTPS